MEIRVAIFEDNPIMSDAYLAILNGTKGFLCVGAYKEGSGWKHAMEKSKPHVVLMDIDMPGLDGIQATRLIRHQFPSIKILIQTIFENDEKVFDALCAGANGYITKDTPPSKMLDAISDVHQSGAAFSPAIAAKIIQLFQQFSPSVLHKDYQLTPREKEVLVLMTQGLSLPKIAERIFLSYETIRGYVKNIYQKLHVTSNTEAVAKALKEKLV